MKENLTIIGAGITGLATAYVLSSQYEVTIIARDLPGDMNLNWASPWAGAVFHPSLTPNKLHQKMQRTSYLFYSHLANTDPSCGVKIYPMTEYFDTSTNPNNTEEEEAWYTTLMPQYRPISTSELPPGMNSGATYLSLAINPLVFLPWLKYLLEDRGVHFIRCSLSSIAEARSLAPAKIIVNASGLGSKELVGDESVMPIKGQTMFIKTDFEECLMIDTESEYTYIIPRPLSGGVIIGGIELPHQVDHSVSVDIKHDILRRINVATKGRFRRLDVHDAEVTDIVGFRPGRKDGMRIQREGDVVHAYGMGGAGYIYSFGAAERVAELVSDIRSLKSKL